MRKHTSKHRSTGVHPTDDPTSTPGGAGVSSGKTAPPRRPLPPRIGDHSAATPPADPTGGPPSPPVGSAIDGLVQDASAPVSSLAARVVAAEEEKEDSVVAGRPGLGFGGTGRALAGAGYVPAAGTRREQRAATRAAAREAAELRRQAGAAAAQARKEAAAAERAATDSSVVLPKAGERGPAALRQYVPLRLPAHKATTDQLAGAYPFLAEAGLGSEGIYVGRDSYAGTSFVYDPWVLYERGIITNPNILVAGAPGCGKSFLCKCLATRSLVYGRKIYVPGDPNGEWTRVARAVGGQAIVLGGSSSERLNPLDEGPRPTHTRGEGGQLVTLSDEQWHRLVTGRRRDLLRSLAAVSLGRELAAVELTALYAALAAADAENTTVILPQVIAALRGPAAGVPGSTRTQLEADGREAAHGLERLVSGDLGGLFDGPSTTAFDTTVPMVSLDLSHIQGSDDLIALVQTCSAAWMESAFTDPTGGQRWVIYDEAWRLFRFPALLARMQAQWKRARHLGIANMAVMHRLSDLDSVGDEGSESRNIALGLLADCYTRIIYGHAPGEAEKTGARIGLTAAEIGQLDKLDQGEGLWKIQNRAFVVSALATPGEFEVFNTDSRMNTGPEAGAA